MYSSPTCYCTISRAHSSREGLDDVTETRIGSNYETKDREKYERHVLCYHYRLSCAIVHMPECADLNEGGERQAQTRETQSTEQGYKQI